MSLFSRIKDQLVGAAHDAVDSAEDVGRTARQQVRNIEDNIGKAEEALISVRAEYNSLVFKRDEAQKQVNQYAEYAKKAIEQNNDALARDALTDKKKAETQVSELQQQIDKFKPSVDAIESKLAELRQQRDQMERDTSMLAARSAVAEARTNAANVLGGIGNHESAVKTFDRLADKTAKAEAEADARTQLAAEKKVVKPEDKYAALNTTASASSIDDELAAMKASLGK